MFMSVDLPEPDGPMIATNSPRLDLQRDPLERVHNHVPQEVVLDQILDFNDGWHD